MWRLMLMWCECERATENAMWCEGAWLKIQWGMKVHGQAEGMKVKWCNDRCEGDMQYVKDRNLNVSTANEDTHVRVGWRFRFQVGSLNVCRWTINSTREVDESIHENSKYKVYMRVH